MNLGDETGRDWEVVDVAVDEEFALLAEPASVLLLGCVVGNGRLSWLTVLTLRDSG